MTGSASKVAALIGAGTVAMLVLSACGPTENGPVIGTPATGSVAVANAASSGAMAAFEQQLVDELNQAAQTQSDHESTQISAEVNALANDHTLILAEQVDQLKQIGAAQVAKREATLSSLRRDIDSHARLGSSQVAALLAVVDGVQGQLQSLGAKIAGDSLVDVLRSDVLSVDTSTRVYGLIDPMVHIALAADVVINEAGSLASHRSTLAGEAAARSTLNSPREAFLLAELGSQVSQLQAAAETVVSQVLQLRPGGYPGNASTLQALKSDLVSAQTGPAATAGQTVAELTTCLSDDTASPPTAC